MIFDFANTWRGQNLHYVLFTTINGQVGCGHFREKEGNNFLTAELPDKKDTLKIYYDFKIYFIFYFNIYKFLWTKCN
ncbi:hypothetical protein D3C80_2063050 [compost metagenome]